MGTTAAELKRLQAQVKKLESRVAELQRVLRAHGLVSDDKRTRAQRATLSEREHANDVLRRAGLLAELTPEEKARAADWEALPEARKQQVLQVLEATSFNPPLSETVLRGRD